MASPSPMDVPAKSWKTFVEEDYVPTVLEAQELAKLQDPEIEPFKSKYLAIEKLSNLRHQGTAFTRAEGLLSTEQKAECKDMLAMLDVKRGSLALDTEDPSLAEKLLTSATIQLKISEDRNVEALQDAYNLLGVIWSNRDEQKKAEAFLLEAQRLYHKHCRPDTTAPALVSSAPSTSTASDKAAPSTESAAPDQTQAGVCEPTLKAETSDEEEPSSSGPTANKGAESCAGTSTSTPGPATLSSAPDSRTCDSAQSSSGGEKAEFLYTMTAFYLAQVYGHSRQQGQMAEYLGITLDRQLRMGHNFEPLDWAQNCAQVSGYFVQQGAYETAAHCLAAAGAVLERAGITLQTETGGDVLANVLIGWGKMHMQLIANSRSLFATEEQPGGSPPLPNPPVLQDRSNLQPTEDGKPSAVKVLSQREKEPGVQELRFGSLDLPSNADVLTGCDGRGGLHSYEDAVKHFNKAMAAFKGALEYYQLDGHVTEHCNILFDISTLHRYLAFLESNESRICQLHKRRATRLEPLVSALNPTAFLAIVRQLTYELASINQEIVDVRLSHSRPFSKYAAAARDAIRFYTLFLDSFKDVKGQLPERIEEGEEAEYLLAQVQLAMLRYKLYNRENQDRSIEDLIASLDLYNSFLKYVEKHKVKGMDERVRVCKEMAELLPTKINTERAGKR